MKDVKASGTVFDYLFEHRPMAGTETRVHHDEVHLGRAKGCGHCAKLGTRWPILEPKTEPRWLLIVLVVTFLIGASVVLGVQLLHGLGAGR